MSMESEPLAGIAAGPVLRLSEAAKEYLASRGLSLATAAQFGVASATAFFPSLNRRCEAVYFPYYDQGQRVGWKARAFPDKAFIAQKGGKQALLNIDKLIEAAPGDIYLTEGEIDAASLVEAGIPVERVTSVPGGAGGFSDTDEPADTNGRLRARDRLPAVYPWLADAQKRGLGKHTRFIWCGDSDEVGLAMRERMARQIGMAKFWFVDWPAGCKDANDVLRVRGPKALADWVSAAAKPWPVVGVYTLSELPEPPPIQIWDTGWSSWDKQVHIGSRCLSVVTGHGGHGKTLWTAQLWFQIAQQYDLKIAIASYETEAKPEYRRILRTLFTSKLEVAMSAAEIAAADEWIDDHYLWIQHPERRPTVAWFLNTAEAAVVRRGAKIVLADPWNRFEHSRSMREREDEYIGRCLREIHDFAKDLDVHFQVVAHPAKMDGMHRGKAPDLEDISGAKVWETIPDQGFIVYRPKLFDDFGHPMTDCHVIHRKARRPALGYDCLKKLAFDRATGHYLDLPTLSPVRGMAA